MKFIAVSAAIMVAASSVDADLSKAICVLSKAKSCQTKSLPELLDTPLAELCQLRTNFHKCFFPKIASDCDVQLKIEGVVLNKICGDIPAFEGPLECLREQRDQTVPLLNRSIDKVKRLLLLNQTDEEINNTICCGIQKLRSKVKPIVDKCKSNEVFEAFVDEVVEFGSNVINDVVKMTPDCCEHISEEAKAILNE